VPFGPFMSLGGIITLYWGNQIINWYINFYTGRGSIF
jgi:prepilin signal peptidase PulO-like enzyme (type II secretory pathway)